MHVDVSFTSWLHPLLSLQVDKRVLLGLFWHFQIIMKRFLYTIINPKCATFLLEVSMDTMVVNLYGMS